MVDDGDSDDDEAMAASFQPNTAPGFESVRHCSLPADEPVTAGLYNLTVTCNNYNVDVPHLPYRQNYAYGAATFDRWSDSTSAFDNADGNRALGDEVYHTVVVPEILHVSERVSGLNGGQTITIKGTGFDAGAVRGTSRSIPPRWRTIRFRPALRTHAPWGCIVRVVSQTKSRKIPTRDVLPLFPVIRAAATTRCRWRGGRAR